MATRSLGTLTLDLIARLGGFEAGMDKAARVSEQRLKKIKDNAEKVGKAIGVGFAAGVTGLTAIIKHSLDAADDMSKLARSTGLTSEALSQLQYAADLSGVEDLGGTLNKFNKNIGEAKRGTLDQAQAFAALGVEVVDANGQIRSTEDILNDTADAFSKYADGASKSNIAQRLFGRSGADLITFLDGGKKGINELREEADRLGLTLNQDTATAAENFNDNLSRVKAVSQGLTNQVLNGLTPTLKDLSDQLVAYSTNAKDVQSATGFIDRVLKGLIVSGIAVSATFTAIGKTIGGVLAASQRALQDVGPADAVVPGLLVYHLAKNAKATGAILSDAYSDARASVSDDIEAMANVIKAGNKKIADAAAPAGGDKPQLTLAGAVAASTKKAAKEQTDAVQQMIDALADQAATLGFNDRALALYKAAGEGATNAQIDQINVLYDNIDAFKEAGLATEAYQKQQEDLKALQASFKDAPSFGGIDALVGGAGGELDKIDESRKELENWYAEQLDLLNTARSERADLNAEWDEKEAAIKKEHEDKLLAIEKARQRASLAVAGDIFGNLAALSRSKNKELGAIGKAAAIAQATISGIQAVQNALAVSPYPLGLALAASAGIATAANIAEITGVGFESGGYTGNFGRKQIAGVVHGQEFVVNAEATAKYRNALQAMNDGNFAPTISPNALKFEGQKVVNNAPGLVINKADGIVTIDMVPELLEVATGRARVAVSSDARDLRSPLSQSLQRVHRTAPKAAR